MTINATNTYSVTLASDHDGDVTLTGSPATTFTVGADLAAKGTKLTITVTNSNDDYILSEVVTATMGGENINDKLIVKKVDGDLQISFKNGTTGDGDIVLTVTLIDIDEAADASGSAAADSRDNGAYEAAGLKTTSDYKPEDTKGYCRCRG